MLFTLALMRRPAIYLQHVSMYQARMPRDAKKAYVKDYLKDLTKEYKCCHRHTK